MTVFGHTPRMGPRPPAHAAARASLGLLAVLAVALLLAERASAQSCPLPGDLLVVDNSSNPGRVIAVDLDTGDQCVVPSGGNTVPFPRGIDVDESGRLFLTASDVVLRVDPSIPSTGAVRSGPPITRPEGIAVEPRLDANGDVIGARSIFVASAPLTEPAIWKFDAVTGVGEELVAVAGELFFPEGLVRESDGNLIVTDIGGILNCPSGRDTPCGFGLVRVFPDAPPAEVFSGLNQEVLTQGGLLERPRRSALLSDGDGTTLAAFVTDSDIPGVVCVPLVDAAGDPLPFDPADPEANQVLVTSGDRLARPIGIVVEEAGDAMTQGSLLVGDGTTDRVVRIRFDAGDPCPAAGSGVQETVSSGGLLGRPWEVQFARPPAVLFEGLPYYVSDANGVYRVDPVAETRTDLALVGDGPTGGPQLTRPAAVALDLDGNVLVTDIASAAVFRIRRKLDGNGDPLDPLEFEAIEVVSSGNLLMEPTGITVDSTGDILVVDAGDPGASPAIPRRIVRLRTDEDPPRQILVADAGTTASCATEIDGEPVGAATCMLSPVSLTIDEQGQLVVSDEGDDMTEPHLVVVDPISSPLDAMGLPLAGRGVIPTPPPPALPPIFDVVLDEDTTLLFTGDADAGEEQLLRVLTPDAGGGGAFVYRSESESLGLATPRELAIDLDRSILVVDEGGGGVSPAVLRIDPLEPDDAAPVEVFSGPLSEPWGIAVEILPEPAELDTDPVGESIVGDGVVDSRDNCPNVVNPKRCSLDRRLECSTDVDCIPLGFCVQFDDDGDGRGNACDNCLEVPNVDPQNEAFPQDDRDLDGFGDACDFVCDLDNDGTVTDDERTAVEDAVGSGPTCATDDTCSDGTDCDPNDVCIESLGVCREPEGTPCTSDDDCQPGDECLDDPASSPIPICYSPKTRACTLGGTECADDEECLLAPEDCDLDGDVDQDDVDQVTSEVGLSAGPSLDFDDDAVADDIDNCPDDFNPRVCCADTSTLCSNDNSLCDDASDCGTGESCKQPDVNDDGIGDACQDAVTGDDPDGDGVPSDGDGSGTIGDNFCRSGELVGCDDNCPDDFNPSQLDEDGDRFGDVCDACPSSVVKACSGDLGVACSDDGECEGIGSCEPLDFVCSGDESVTCSVDDDCTGIGSCVPLEFVCSGDQSVNCFDDDDCTGTGIASRCVQRDFDVDGFPNVCDNCPSDSNPGRCSVDTLVNCDVDAECPPIVCDDGTCSDGSGDACSSDADCTPQTCSGQSDVNGDGIGDVCQDDVTGDDPDEDGWPAAQDNCLDAPNGGQEDSDGDGRGNACDNCDDDPNPEQFCNVSGAVCDQNADCREVCVVPEGESSGNCAGSGASCDEDTDCGERCDTGTDTCVNDPGVMCQDDAQCQICLQTDSDGDGEGDICDNCPDDPVALQPDVDGDGRGSDCDNCPTVPNPPRCELDPATTCTIDDQCAPGDRCIQFDEDMDGVGNACEDVGDPTRDVDDDTWPDSVDNCSAEFNLNQIDSNGDGFGNVCDSDYTNDGLIGGPDFVELTLGFGKMPGEPGYDRDLDTSDDPAGDGVFGPEFVELSLDFGQPPGPACGLPPPQACSP